MEVEYGNLIPLKKKICCLEKDLAAALANPECPDCPEVCDSNTFVSVDDAPTEVPVGEVYEVFFTLGGMDIGTTFQEGALIADILVTLNDMFSDFEVNFTVNGDNKLQADVTNNNSACDFTFRAESVEA